MAAPEIFIAGRPAREPECRGEAPGWCDATREWRVDESPSSESRDESPSSESRDSFVAARFPLVVRAEPLLGSGDPAAAAEGTSKTGPNQSGEGIGARHAMVAGPFVLAALGPGAWVGDLGVAPPKIPKHSESNARASRSESGGFHDGAGEVTDGVWALSRRAPRRVAFRLASESKSSSSESKSFASESKSFASESKSFASAFGARGRRRVESNGGFRAPRYLGAIAERADGGFAADGVASDGTIEPYVGAGVAVVEPLLRPSADGAPGGSGYFYARHACDARSCANVMADAVAVTWNLLPRTEDGKGNDEARTGSGTQGSSDGVSDDGAFDGAFEGAFDAFELEPMGAPGLRLAAAAGGRRGRADAVVLTAAPDARRLTLRRDIASRRLVVVDDASSSDSLAGRVLCADALARDFPGAGGCADLDRKCAEWARGGECVRNQGFMHGACPVSCGTCRPAGVRLVPAEDAADEDCAFEAVTDEKEDEKVGEVSERLSERSVETTRAASASDANSNRNGDALLPARPARGSFVAVGPDATRLPYVLLSPLTLLRDEVYTVYLRLSGGEGDGQ